MPRQAISTSQAPKAIGPYSQAIAVPAGEMVFVSGQIPIHPETGEMVGEGIVAQTERVMENLKAVLAAANLSFDHVVKTTILLTDLGDFAKVNETYGRYFSENPPARATFQVAALPRGACVEIEAIAVR